MLIEEMFVHMSINEERKETGLQQQERKKMST